jgi:hypothetical protein
MAHFLWGEYPSLRLCCPLIPALNSNSIFFVTGSYRPILLKKSRGNILYALVSRRLYATQIDREDFAYIDFLSVSISRISPDFHHKPHHFMRPLLEQMLLSGFFYTIGQKRLTVANVPLTPLCLPHRSKFSDFRCHFLPFAPLSSKRISLTIR